MTILAAATKTKNKANKEFDKNTSTFKDFAGDSVNIIQACFKNDQAIWKIPKLVKSDNDVSNLRRKLLGKNDIRLFEGQLLAGQRRFFVYSLFFAQASHKFQ